MKSISVSAVQSPVQTKAAWILGLFAGAGLLTAAEQPGPAAAQDAADSVLAGIEVHGKAHPRGEAAFTWDRETYRNLNPKELADLPVGVFDSGVGGLTVLEALLTADAFDNGTLRPGPDGRPDLAGERFLYLGDQANMPYGNYPARGREDTLRELILKDAVFLLGKRYHLRGPDGALLSRFDKPPVKAIVIACNTATAYGLETIREALRRWDLPVPVVGVVEAGVRGLAQEPDGGGVGVMATMGTCASEVYPRTIARTFGQRGRRPPLVTQRGSARLAGVIEGDPAVTVSLEEEVAIEARGLVEAHRAQATARMPGAPVPLRNVILGCTHFPLALAELDTAFARLRTQPDLGPWLAPRITFIDPAKWTARELFTALAESQLRRRNPPPAPSGAAGAEDRFFVSVANDACAEGKRSAPGVLDADYKHQRRPGRLEVEDTVVVPMTRALLPEVSRGLLQRRLPAVWARLPES